MEKGRRFLGPLLALLRLPSGKGQSSSFCRCCWERDSLVLAPTRIQVRQSRLVEGANEKGTEFFALGCRGPGGCSPEGDSLFLGCLPRPRFRCPTAQMGKGRRFLEPLLALWQLLSGKGRSCSCLPLARSGTGTRGWDRDGGFDQEWPDFRGEEEGTTVASEILRLPTD